MAGMMNSAPASASTSTGDGGTNTFALGALTSLFFMWGFITCLNDILIPHLKGVFSLTYTEAMLIQFCFFGAYFLVSLPAGALVRKLGYKKGIVVGLLTAAVGCLLFYPAASAQAYPLFLGALFVLASGITVLQVSANPYVTALGNPDTAASRLTMTQAFNSLGTTVAPFFGAMLILAGADAGAEAMGADAVKTPYLMLAAALAVLAAIFSQLKLPEITEHAVSDDTSTSDTPSAWTHSHLVLGAVGIFVYVGAEVSIGSFLVNFLGEESIAGMEESEAAKYIAYYWGGAMVGRFIGAVAMQKVKAGNALAFCAMGASLLIATAVFSSGSLAMWAILAVGLFNSIMFPTIFSLAINLLGDRTSQGAGILCLGIVGGALIPVLQGMMADAMGIQLAFLMPIVCYVYIAYYGLKGSAVKAG
jgi:FHS family L-fucose permease-like MFS transporter